jgi:hypothetical protein
MERRKSGSAARFWRKHLCKSASGLERLADVQPFTCGNAAYGLKANVHEIKAPVPAHHLVME